MADALTDNMKEFLDSNPTADAVKAKALQDSARNNFKKVSADGKFELYGQDTPGVIARRYVHPPAQQPADSNGRQTLCCLRCPDRPTMIEFKRHNNEVHIMDPAHAFFCPYCTVVLFRIEPTSIDEHLATHCKFPNSVDHGSRAYAFLNSTEETVLKKLIRDTLIHLAGTLDQAKIEDVKNRRLNVLANIPANFHQCLTIHAEFTIPVVRAEDLRGLMKDALINYIIFLRQKVEEYKESLAAAESLATALRSFQA